MYSLFSNCKLTKGYTNSTIVDLQRGVILIVPKVVADEFDQNGTIDVDKKDKEFVRFIKYLVEQRVLYKIDEFIDSTYISEIEMNLAWPDNRVANVIIEHDINLHQPSRIGHILSCVNCDYIELRILGHSTVELFESLLKAVEEKTVMMLNVVVTDGSSLTWKNLHEIKKQFRFMHQLFVYSSKDSRADLEKSIYVSQRIYNINLCGVIDKDNFTINMYSYLENLNHNSCLNRKVTIDRNGDIKNCPAMSTVYGNIFVDDIENVLLNSNIKKYWSVAKDSIETCKYCEFRYVCTDCRAYVEKPITDLSSSELNLSKPLKCGYDPYKGTWEDWSQNPLKTEAMSFYDIDNFT